MTTPADGLPVNQEKKLAVGDTVYVGSMYGKKDADLMPLVVTAVRRKYFTVGWKFSYSEEIYPVDFSIETGEMRDNQWVGGYAKAWTSPEARLTEIKEEARLATIQEHKNELSRGSFWYCIPDDQIEAVWAIVGPKDPAKNLEGGE